MTDLNLSRALNLSIALLLAGCGGSQMSGTPGAVPESGIGSALKRDELARPLTRSCPAATCIYVANTALSPSAAGSITVYPTHASGNVGPYRTISGGQTGLTDTMGIAVDSRGKVYVSVSGAQSNEDSLSVFGARANGDVKPLRTIAGPATRLNLFNGIALSGGEVYANNFHNTNRCRPFNGCLRRGYVTAYPSGSDGNAAPTRIIKGERTGIWVMNGINITVDGSGDVYVVNNRECLYSECWGKTGILVYQPVVRGRSAASWVISGSKTGFKFPNSVAVDGAGNVYVSDDSIYPHVFVYEAGQHGNVAPVQSISGSKTKLSIPTAIAVDAERNIYVANWVRYGTSSILVYAAGATGNVAPIRIIKGSKTGLTTPWGIAVH